MGIYVKDLKKPEKCFECLLVGGYAEAPGRLYCPAVKPQKRVEGEALPGWCPIVEIPEEEYEVGREAVERIKKAIDEAVMNGKATPQNWREWSTQRFYNMDSALTRIEELAQQMQEDAKKISDIVNEGFTVKQVRLRYGGYGDESRTEDA